MSELEEKLSAVMANPQLMQQIMSMAQSFAPPQAPPPPPETPPPPAPPPGFDLSAMQKLGALAGQSSVDKNQQQLLCALSPYLCGDRIAKLERAMRAAKLAQLATGLLGGTLGSKGR